MLPWLVITAEHPHAGRGVRGYALTWFLQTYFGRRAVAQRSPAQFLRSPQTADTLFLGLPSTLSPAQIEDILREARPRRVAVFDYLDQHPLAWTPEQADVLRPRVVGYFKPWREPAWRYDAPMRLLPLRLRTRLSLAVAWDRAADRLGGPPRPRYDVAFLGRPNRTRLVNAAGEVEKYDQRIEWLRDLKHNAPDLRVWGGLSGGDDPDRAVQTALYGSLADIRFPRGKASFHRYWRALRRSRVQLAPGGNVPWTYRHYECLYAGGLVVSIDYRHRDMLIPLPVELMVHVPDRAPVTPAVREALELGARRPALRRDVHRHLDQYLRCGGYSANRPLLIDRFTQQLA